MTPVDILEIASHPDVPKFVFGSPELDAWHSKHIDPYTGECFEFSNWYVVIHKSESSGLEFQVLSIWHKWSVMPVTFEVSDPIGAAA